MSTVTPPRDGKSRRIFLLKYFRFIRKKFQGPIINYPATGTTFTILTGVGVDHIAAAILSVGLGLLTKPRK